MALIAQVAEPAYAHGGDASAFAANGASTNGKIVVATSVQRALGIVSAPVEERQLPDDLVLTGQVEALPSKSLTIVAPIAGRLVRMDAQRGSIVAAGQPVAVIDSAEIRSLAVEGQRTTATARAQRAQVDARLTLARSTLERQRALLAAGIAARKDVEVARADVAAASAERDATETQANLAYAALSARRASLGQSGVGGTPNGTVVVSATGAGVVVDQPATAGQSVAEDTPILKIVDTSTVSIAGAVYEKDLGRLRTGLPVAVAFQDAPSQTFLGSIATIEPLLDGASRTATVRATFANAAGKLRPGMFATMHVLIGVGGKSVVAIPRTAVLDPETKPTVFVQDKETFQATPVVLGRTSGEFVEILDGVFPGDRVVTQRAFQLRGQLLKGPAPSTDEKAPAKTETASTSVSGSALPLRTSELWIAGFVALAIAFLGFFVGRVSRRNTVRNP